MKIKNKEFEFWIDDDIDTEQLNDSMELDSLTTIATLKRGSLTASLEIRGEVKIWWNEHGNPGDGEYFTSPSEFPQNLKDIISGKATIFRADNDIDGIEHNWTLDERLNISENNWFELFIWNTEDGINAPLSEVVDAEHSTAGEIFDMLNEMMAEIYPELIPPLSAGNIIDAVKKGENGYD